MSHISNYSYVTHVTYVVKKHSLTFVLVVLQT